MYLKSNQSEVNNNYSNGNALAQLFNETNTINYSNTSTQLSINKHIDTYTIQVKENIDKKYNKIVREFSGDFSLDPVKTNEWITSQYNDFRQAVCLTLVNHHKYYNINETIKLLDDSVIKCLSKYESHDKKKYIILLSDDKPSINDTPGGSILMFSIIGYMLLKKNGVPEDNIYFSKLIDFKNNDHRYFMFDDFSYSGSQLNQTLNKIYLDLLLLDELPPFDLNIILCGVTDLSKIKVKQININDELFKILKDKYPTRLGNCRNIYRFIKRPNDTYPFNILPSRGIGDLPFNLYYGSFVESFISLNKKHKLKLTYKERTYTSDEIYKGLTFFFRPCWRQLPSCVYFSHKRADYASTMAEILQYGPIIPMNYSIKFEQLERILDDGNIFQKTPTFYETSQRMINEEKEYQRKINKEMEEPKLKCIPCIKGCSNIKLNDIKSFFGFNHDLVEFLISSSDHQKREIDKYFEIQDLIDTYNATYKKSDRCPASKYKQETFFNYLTGGLKKRKNKTKRNKLKNKKNIKTKRKTKK